MSSHLYIALSERRGTAALAEAIAKAGGTFLNDDEHKSAICKCLISDTRCPRETAGMLNVLVWLKDRGLFKPSLEDNNNNNGFIAAALCGQWGRNAGRINARIDYVRVLFALRCLGLRLHAERIMYALMMSDPQEGLNAWRQAVSSDTLRARRSLQVQALLSRFPPNVQQQIAAAASVGADWLQRLSAMDAAEQARLRIKSRVAAAKKACE
jgi:hypothetical protein